MRYRALAIDYDGTLAHDGRVDDRTAGAIERLRASGCRLVLATGRIREDLERVHDLAMLATSACGVAVDNALASVKRAADHVTRGARGDGVVEVLDALLADDLVSVEGRRRPRGSGR